MTPEARWIARRSDAQTGPMLVTAGTRKSAGGRSSPSKRSPIVDIELAYQRPERGDARGDLVALDLGDEARRYSDASRDLADAQTLPLALTHASEASDTWVFLFGAMRLSMPEGVKETKTQRIERLTA